jgi:ATP-binding cassette subfamily F protein 3
MLQLKNVTLYRGSKCILDDASVTIHKGEKVGIVGSNGVGKSSLFQMILGQLETDKGDYELPNNLRITQIKQEVPSGEQTALNYALSGDQQLAEVFQQLASAEAGGDGMLIAECHCRLAELDGYSVESRAAKILIGLGFTHNDLQRPIDDFSGGWRMRLNLAQVLLAPSDLLLLDEPTNHLDLEAIFWLENWLRDCAATTLIISHDREFLDHVAARILFIKDQNIHSFSGDYSSFEEQYAMQLELQQANYLKQQRQISHMMKFVDRYRAKASKAKQAQARLKMIDRMEKVEAVHLTNPFHFQFRPIEPAGNPMISFHNVAIGYDEQTILRNVSASIHPGDRIALLGKNGAGKSTLIKALAQLNKVDGEQIYHPKVKIGYFTQHQIEGLTLNQSALWHLQELAPTITEKEARSFLGGFNFSNDRIFEPLSHFSGGEKARLALALLVWQQPNLLLLDEPSNHLDLEMRQALMMALQNYQGALILVAHDQYLLKNLPENYWLVKDGTVTSFSGDLADYHQLLTMDNEAPVEKIAPKKVATVVSNNLQKNYEKLEMKLASIEQSLADIEIKLAEPSLYQETAQASKLAELQQLQQQYCTQRQAIEKELLELIEQL